MHLTITCTGRLDVPEDWAGERSALSACGRQFDIEVGDGDPGDVDNWDIHTDPNGEVIRRSKAVLCPFCGTETFIVDGRT